MGNVKSAAKIFKNARSFLTKTGRKKSLQKITQHADQLDSVPSISAKTLAFQSLL